MDGDQRAQGQWRPLVIATEILWVGKGPRSPILVTDLVNIFGFNFLIFSMKDQNGSV